MCLKILGLAFLVHIMHLELLMIGIVSLITDY